MVSRSSAGPRYLLTVAGCTAVLAAGGMSWVGAQQPPQAPAGQAQQGRGGGFGGGRGNAGPAIFTVVDANKDGAVTRDEMKATFDRWFTEWDSAKAGALTQEQLLAGLNAALPAPAPPAGGGFPGGGRGAQPQNQTPDPAHVQAMLAALPATAPAKPRQPRRVLVLGKAAGFVHSSIPIAARTIEEMGKKTGAWSTTITYDSADINEANLKQYDAIFLASTTGAFLDDPNDAAATAARRKALLDFVRGGKGLAGIHAATDSYHQNRPSTDAPAGGGRAAGPGGGGRGGGRGGQAAPVVTQFLAQGDKNADQKISREEFGALADAWYAKLDTTNSGRVAQADFPQRFTALFPAPAPPALGRTGFPIQPPATNLGPDNQVGTWPEFNTMIGGFFKFHWNDGQEIYLKIDEPNHPLNAAFKGKPQLLIVDETYTFGRDTYSRKNLRVLKSVDYAKMSDEDKKKESNPRDDGDYALSWIRREGKGRVFYEAHGHNEKIYAIAPILEHVLAGMQYVLGDLQADDSPSQK
jgi:type 1 glutamine amidotransferase